MFVFHCLCLSLSLSVSLSHLLVEDTGLFSVSCFHSLTSAGAFRGALSFRLLAHSSCCFCCLPPVGKVGSVGCVGFLVEEIAACVLVDEAASFLSGGQDRVRWYALGYL